MENLNKDPSKIRDSWTQTFGGSGNANKVAVLEEGMKYTPISISPEQAQFLETRKFQINEIVRIFRVPPHMLGDLERSTFSNIEEQSLEFVKYTLSPWISRIERIEMEQLSEDDRETTKELLDELDSKINMKKKPEVIKATLIGLKDFLINAGANVAAEIIIAKLQGFL